MRAATETGDFREKMPEEMVSTESPPVVTEVEEKTEILKTDKELIAEEEQEAAVATEAEVEKEKRE